MEFKVHGSQITKLLMSLTLNEYKYINILLYIITLLYKYIITHYYTIV